MLFGKLMGFVVISSLGECIGKKSMITGGVAGVIVGILIALLRINLEVVSLGLFVMMTGEQTITMASNIFITEKVGEEYRSRASIFTQAMFGMGTMYGWLDIGLD